MNGVIGFRYVMNIQFLSDKIQSQFMNDQTQNNSSIRRLHSWLIWKENRLMLNVNVNVCVILWKMDKNIFGMTCNLSHQTFIEMVYVEIQRATCIIVLLKGRFRVRIHTTKVIFFQIRLLRRNFPWKLVFQTKNIFLVEDVDLILT